jgi:hypothetical protein
MEVTSPLHVASIATRNSVQCMPWGVLTEVNHAHCSLWRAFSPRSAGWLVPGVIPPLT